MAETIREVFWMTTADKRQILYISPGYETIWGRTCQSLYDSPINWVEAIHPDDRQRVLEAALTKQALGRYHEEYRIVRPDGSQRWISDRGLPIRDEAGEVYRIAGIAEDITSRKLAERRLAAEHAVIRALAESSTLQEGATRILQAVCECLGWEAGAIWQVDGPVEVMNCVEVWCASPAEMEEFELATYTTRVTRGDGFSGRVWEGGKAFWVPDVSSDPNLPRAPIAIRCGLHAALGVPVMLRGQVCGDLEFFSRQIRQPDTALLNMLSALADQIGQFLARKQAEAQIATLAHAVESTVEMICITDLQDRFIFVNRAFQETYGYTEAEILGRKPDMLVSPNNPPSLLEEILENTRMGSWRGEVLDTRKDGTEIPIFLSTSQIRDDSGQVIALMGVAQDITARKQAERQIRMLADAVQSTQELISITDPENRFTFVNQAFLTTYGYSEVEILGRTPDFLYSAKNPPGLCQQVFEHTVQGGWKGEILNLRKDGSDFPISLSTSQIKDAEGRVIGLIGVARDISDRKQAEAVLRESERKLRLIAENSKAVFFLFDMDRTPLYANPAVQDLTGYSFAEIQAKKFINWLHPDDHERMLAHWDEVYAGKGYSDLEYRMVTRGGQVKWCSSSWVPTYDETGRQIGVQGIERDISERKQLESEVLESANNERRRIGHELHDSLCQFLAGIAFRAKALEQNLVGQAPQHASEAAELVALISKSISQARSLARGLDPVEVETIGLPAALQNLAAETEKFFNLVCLVRCPDMAMPLNHQTSMALFRIVQEAIHNAIAHGGAGRIDIALAVDSGSLCLRVQDDGSGFDAAKTASNGMGLRVMQYRARSIGATLELGSRPGQGTQIRCLVPLDLARKIS